MAVATRYALSGDAHIAYQVVGEGDLDLVLVPAWFSHLEVLWENEQIAAFVRGIARFARLIMFDRRGSGLSEGSVALPLDEQIDDLRAVLRATRAEKPAFFGFNESCGMAAMFAAAHPSRVRALLLWNPMARMTSAPGYEWASSPAEWRVRTEQLLTLYDPDISSAGRSGHVGDFIATPWGARLGRLSMGPGEMRATREAMGRTDYRDVLGNVRCPTLVMRRSNDRIIDAQHARFAAERISGAHLVEFPGDEMWFFARDIDPVLAEIERFLTGIHRLPVSDRVLATVLFSDIVDSTARAADLGDERWRGLLQRHDELVAAEVERQRGRVVKSLGDGAFAIFDAPTRAIAAAMGIREGVETLGIEVRAGLHTGECELLPGDDVGGLAVHIGARVSALAGSGEILVSSTVRDLVAGARLRFDDRGEYELKGVPEPRHLYSVT